MNYLFPADIQEGLTEAIEKPPFEAKILLPYADLYYKEGSFGCMHKQSTSGNGFQINLKIFQILEPVQLTIHTAEPYAILTYIMGGKATYTLEGWDLTTVEQGHYYMFYFPPGLHPMQLDAGDYIMVQIELCSDLLCKLAGTRYVMFETLNRLTESDPAGLIFYASWINNRVWDVLQRMLYCTYEEEERLLFQEARILELLLIYAQDDTNNEKKSGQRYKFTPEDIAAVKAAGDLKMENLDEFISLKELAKKVNQHPRKLQAGFQEVYGQGVAKLATAAKIEKAKQLLMETNMKIESIAFDTGFCNASSFIRAFKRHEGITPAKYRK